MEDIATEIEEVLAPALYKMTRVISRPERLDVHRRLLLQFHDLLTTAISHSKRVRDIGTEEERWRLRAASEPLELSFMFLFDDYVCFLGASLDALALGLSASATYDENIVRRASSSLDSVERHLQRAFQADMKAYVNAVRTLME